MSEWHQLLMLSPYSFLSPSVCTHVCMFIQLHALKRAL